jgi:hypothetical protein
MRVRVRGWCLYITPQIETRVNTWDSLATLKNVATADRVHFSGVT